MSDARQLLLDTATRVLNDLCTRPLRDAAEQGVWPAGLWDGLSEAGLTLAATAESRGGPGIDPGDFYALVRTAGAHAIPVPFIETLLAEQALAAAGLPPMPGPLTVGPSLRGDRLILGRGKGRWTVSGTLHRVPWARHACAIVAIAEFEAQPVTIVIEQPLVEREDWNYAREPRDDLRFDARVIRDERVAAAGAGLSADNLFARGALMRAVAMAGALETVLDLTVTHAKERVQFGRPIAKFQAIQQQIAVLASQVAAASAAAQGAVDASGDGAALFEIAAAKARIGEAAGIAAEIAHQVHAAMGFAQEHPLHRSTRRLWSWRDEFGTESEWAAWVGHAVGKVGGEGLWAFLTRSGKPSVNRQS